MNLTEKEFVKFLSKFDEHPFDVKIGDEVSHIGKGESEFTVIFHKIPSMKELLTSTSIALGEAYMDGKLEIEGDLYHALNMFLGQMGKFSTDKKALKKLIFSSLTKKNQQKEVSSHYDIGNDFYKIWLDDTLSYSCAYFKNNDDSLYDAQMNKIHYILRKLNLSEGLSLLDIGCGWGGLLIEAAKIYKIRGLGITLSEEQYKAFKERIEKESLQEYLDVKLMDYRELENSKLSFDRIVSVGMIEHVGRPNYDLFFKNVNVVLKESGLFLLHYISGLKESEGDAWIKKYIFPGGVIPSLREIISISSEYKYHILDVESLRLHYKKTLLMWAKNFDNNIDKIKAMFDDEFIRMWRMYLYSCAASFNNGVIDLHQILFVKGVNNNLPMTRSYMYK